MGNSTKIKIFIACSRKLEQEKKELKLEIQSVNKRYPHLHLEPVDFKDNESGSYPDYDDIQDAINPLVDGAQIVISLFYSMVGEFTLEEYNRAIDKKIKVYLYFKTGFSPKGNDQYTEYGKIIHFRDTVDKEKKVLPVDFTDTPDLCSKIKDDLYKYIDKTFPSIAKEEAVSELKSSSNQYIPLAPRPYIAHPYSIVKNFTGRREEMTRLTEWYKYEKEPMCIIEAIGGMGKSALCWKWMQDEIIATDTKVEGIIWWSFYDQGFEDFIHHMYEYCIPENIRNQKQRIDETTEVINAFANHNFLLVLDGFERVLRGYAQMMAMYIQEAGLSQKIIADKEEAYDIHQRTPITPKAERLLRALCTGNSKTLMTTRLYPATIEGLAGIKHIKLTGLSKTDTIAFFKTEGIVGTDEEMIHAGEVYGFHPLMLKLLSTAIKRSFTKDIKKAFSGSGFTRALIDQKEPQKILATSYNLLNADEQKVVATLSVFRSAFTFDAAKALFPDMKAEKLEEIMMELCNLGFLLYNEQQRIFDFHPIMRSYLYDGLTSKETVHQLAITYFTAQPAKEKVITLADLEPVIEQYHHLVRAGKYDDAYNLYVDRLTDYLFFQLAQYGLCINLCRQLFAEPEDSRSQLSNNSDQSFILNDLGLCYASIGQLNEANISFTNEILIDYEASNDPKLGSGLKALSEQVYIPSGKLSNGVIYLLKSEILLKDDDFGKALSYVELGNILTAQGCYTGINEEPVADGFLNKAIEYGIKRGMNTVKVASTYEYTKWALAQVIDKDNNKDNGHITEALNWSLKTMENADQFRISNYPTLIHFLGSYEALSRALIAAMQIKVPLHDITGKVFFYDEHFQNIIETMIPDSSNHSILAERCVHEGLTLSRRSNKVFFECNFSLLCAQLEWQKIRDKEKEISHFNEVEKWVNDTHSLAERIGYRILLADLHLFCAETLIELRELKPGYTKLLKLSAKEHLEKARDYAKDTSSIDDIFLPPDGTADEFYKDIPEYIMLKRGMTEDERIKKGYYAAWLRADGLEKRL
jgi:hypothetical protein